MGSKYTNPQYCVDGENVGRIMLQRFIDDFNTYHPNLSGWTHYMDCGVGAPVDVLCYRNGKAYGVEVKTRKEVYNTGYFLEPDKLDHLRECQTVSGYPAYYINFILPTDDVLIYRYTTIHEYKDRLPLKHVTLYNGGQGGTQTNVPRYQLPVWMASKYNLTTHTLTPPCLPKP